jgi:type IX secretion system PorP/SprF family membrane protein
MKKNLQKLSALLLGTVMFGATYAQDIHFSQYNATPMLLNPALAGLNECDYRIHANFRVQWPTVSSGNTYRTFAGGADMAIGKITKYNSYAGLGLSFFSDQAGSLSFNTNRVDLSFAYHFMLNKKGTMQMSAGLQGGLNIRGINASKATFDSQYDPSTGLVDPNGTKESFGRNRIIFGDAGFGLLYSAMVKNKTNLYLGVSLNHLNQPKISFYPSGQNSNTAGNDRIYIKTTIHGGAAVPVGRRLTVMPNFLVLAQGRAYEFNIGCNFKTLLGTVSTSKTAFHLGAQYRGLFDAIILNTRIDHKGFSAGFSYDINISKLLPASKSVGAPEVFLMYQGCARKKPRPGHCPTMF